MTAVAQQVMPGESLRVLVVAGDPARRLFLMRVVGELGHLPVTEEQRGAIALVDGGDPPADMCCVCIGSGAEDSAAILPPDAASRQIDAALRAVAAGLRVRPAHVGTSGFHELESQPSILLTPRETDVLNALANGLANKEIARRLRISLHTVKFHLESLMRKLNASSRTETVTTAMRLRLLDVLRV